MTKETKDDLSGLKRIADGLRKEAAMDDRNRLEQIASGLRNVSINKEDYDGDAHKAVETIFNSITDAYPNGMDERGIAAWLVKLSWIVGDYMRARPHPRPVRGELFGFQFKTIIKEPVDFPELEAKGVTVTVEIDPELKPYFKDLDRFGYELDHTVAKEIMDQVYEPRDEPRYPNRSGRRTVTGTKHEYNVWPLPTGRED